MFRIALLFAFAAPSALFAVGTQRGDCHLSQPCQLDDRSYHVMEPDGWDGEAALPVLLHFHGWSRTGTHAQGSERVGQSAKRRGVLLVTPNGRSKTWNFWNAGTEDVGFADRVLEDVAKRYPVDADRIYVSGYSYGSAMAWRYACHSGNDVTALLAVAGSIDQNETCPEAPREVRHVHGLADTVMDFPLGPGGDTLYPDAGQVTLDLHPGGHFIPHGWIGRQLDELLGLTPSYP